TPHEADPPRVSISYDILHASLNGAVGGRAVARKLVIQGHPAILEDGPPGPQFISVYWKPDDSHLLSVVGYKLSAKTVIHIAQRLLLKPAGPIHLPISPGSIVSRATALKT